jgi:branched-chain amino acid aminotransferase
LIALAKLKEGGKIRLSIDREAGGTYHPISNDASFFIELIEEGKNFFELNNKGLEIDLCNSIKKQVNVFSNYKTKNGLIFVMAAMEAKERALDDVLLLNDKNSIIEPCSANLFLVSNGILYTPSLSDGCLAGTMRMQIINLAIENAVKVYECSVLPQNLLAADEVFLTNAFQGIKWVSGYRTKRYQNKVAHKFIDWLNQYYGV